MKNLFRTSLAALLCLCTSSAFAGLPTLSDHVFAKGDALGTVTVGVGSGFSQKLSFDYCIVDGWINDRASLGIGGAVGNNLWWSGTDDLSFMATCSFHFQFIDKLDTYVISGIGGGVRFWDARDGHGHDTSGFFEYTEAVGVRYYFTPSFSVNGEVGYTCGSYVMGGISWKF